MRKGLLIAAIDFGAMPVDWNVDPWPQTYGVVAPSLNDENSVACKTGLFQSTFPWTITVSEENPESDCEPVLMLSLGVVVYCSNGCKC